MAGKKTVSKSATKTKKPAARPAAKPAAAASKASSGGHSSVKGGAAKAATRTAAAKAAPAPKAAAARPAPAPAAAAATAAARTKPRTAAPAAPIARALRKSPPVEMPLQGGDAEDMHSLLAGPRNVKPYVAKRGERYMNAVQLRHFQEILQHWKRDLMVEVDRTVTHMKDEAANFPDPNDRATQEEEFSLELRTRDRERKLIRKIDEALARIDDGSYGYCLETGEEIGIKRLEARPVATLTIEAQERRERRERQYGDRDDRYR
jgi:DnaK suppressor protein